MRGCNRQGDWDPSFPRPCPAQRPGFTKGARGSCPASCPQGLRMPMLEIDREFSVFFDETQNENENGKRENGKTENVPVTPLRLCPSPAFSRDSSPATLAVGYQSSDGPQRLPSEDRLLGDQRKRPTPPSERRALSSPVVWSLTTGCNLDRCTGQDLTLLWRSTPAAWGSLISMPSIGTLLTKVG